MGLSLFDERKPYVDLEVIDLAFGTADLNTVSSPHDTIRVDAMIFTSTDVIDHEITIYLAFNSISYTPVCTFNLPAGAGTDGVHPAVDAIPLAFPLQAAVIIPPVYNLACSLALAVTLTNSVFVSTLGGYL